MKKIKHDYARNGVRIALNSKFILLGALAFLCLAIVCLGVFCNLNALATVDIACAGYIGNANLKNLKNHCYFGDFNNIDNLEVTDFIFNQSSYDYTKAYYYIGSFSGDINSVFSFSNHQLTITNNTSDFIEFGCIVPSTIQAGLNFQFAYSVVSQSANISLGYVYRQMDNASNQTYSETYNANALVYYANLNGRYSDTFYGMRVANGSITIDMMAIYNTQITNFLGFVQNSFIPNGYDIGYQAGYDYGTSIDVDEAYELGWAYGYSKGRSEGYAVGFDDGVDSTDSSWDALYALKGHLAIVLGLLPDNFENSDSVAFNNPVGSTNIIFSYMNIIYENSGWVANCSPTGAAVTIKHGSNSGSYTAIKIAENISGVVTIPYISNYANFRLMIVKGGVPTFRSATNYNYVVGNLPCIEVDCGNNADVYLVSNNSGVDITLDIGNIFADGFSPVGIYIYNSQSKQYQNGYAQGLRTGIATADSQVAEAFEAGKIVGRNEASNYTFSSLIGAVIDTPITAAKGLLDFNILGTNMYGLFVGLLSLAVVLFIIRIFSRGL